ncbi:MAG: hypothetical protein JWQ93_2998 [Marmoricola sp.]|jgi:hypothetical protein|nr:hypothetical protein [Marmoricola sp.]
MTLPLPKTSSAEVGVGVDGVDQVGLGGSHAAGGVAGLDLGGVDLLAETRLVRGRSRGALRVAVGIEQALADARRGTDAALRGDLLSPQRHDHHNPPVIIAARFRGPRHGRQLRKNPAVLAAWAAAGT